MATNLLIVTERLMQNKELVIPKEKATFWMDGRGRWHNKHGLFENKKIIAYFNASIALDADGYYVTQQRDGIMEKVYFFHEDTALFVVDVVAGDRALLLLNTGKRILLVPDKLFICNDQLYFLNASERIKFNERALLKIADQIVVEKGNYFFSHADQCYPIPSEPAVVSEK